jgi:hypothetical protein
LQWDPDPDQDQHQEGKSDPDRHQNGADPQHCRKQSKFEFQVSKKQLIFIFLLIWMVKQTGTGMWQYKHFEGLSGKKETSQDPKFWTLKDSSECNTNVPYHRTVRIRDVLISIRIRIHGSITMDYSKVRILVARRQPRWKSFLLSFFADYLMYL